jgi:multidrug efflux system outer membrane protein
MPCESISETFITLVSEVATNYFQLVELDYELEISQRTLDTRIESLRLVRNRREGGAAMLLGLRQAEQPVSSAAESIPQTRQPMEQMENQISLLLGRPPETVISGRRRFLEQELPPDLPWGSALQSVGARS